MFHPLRCSILAYTIFLLLSGSLAQQEECTMPEHSNIHDALPACQTATAGLDQRPLSKLLWSCFIAIAVSSVISIRPDVPACDTKTRSSHGTFKRLVLILWALVAPEIVMLWALRQWIGARSVAEEYQDQGWTTAHGHLMQMGGFVLYDETHHAREVLGPNRFQELLLEGWIEFPRITKQEIADMSKSDTLFKGFCVFQTVWLLVQSVTRAWNGYASTGVELVAASSVISNAVLYFLWWNKPLDVRCPVPVYLVEGTDTQKVKIKEDAYSNHTSSFNIFANLREMSGLVSGGRQIHSSPFNAIASDVSEKLTTSEIRTAQAILAIIAMTGSIFHFGWLAGVLSFPTYTETLLWKVCATAIAGASYALLLHSLRILTLQDKRVELLIDIYVIARILVLLESLLALRQLAPGALNVVTWTSYIPHI